MVVGKRIDIQVCGRMCATERYSWRQYGIILCEEGQWPSRNVAISAAMYGVSICGQAILLEYCIQGAI